MKYFKYKAKYTKEKQRIEQSGGSGNGLIVSGIVGFGNFVGKVGVAAVTGIGNVLTAPLKKMNLITSKKDKQKTFDDIITLLINNKDKINMTEENIKKLDNYDTIVNLIKKLGLSDEKDQLKKFYVCHTMIPFKKIDNECIDLKK